MKQNLLASRIASFDICKGFCILNVILGHQFEKNGLHQPLQFIQTFHMPLFFMIAGYFISDRISMKEFSKRRAKRLLIPYAVSCLIVAILCAVVVLLKKLDIESVWRELLKRLWISLYGSGCGHGSLIGKMGTEAEIGMMWYLIALLWSSIVVKAVSENKMAGIITIMISSVAIGTTMIFGWIPFSIQNGMAVVIWVWLGYYVKKKDLLSDILKFIRSPWILLVFVSWILSAVYGCTHLYGNYYKLGFVDMVGAVAGSILIFGFCSFLDKKIFWIKKNLTWIGANSLLIYCLHFAENNVCPISSVVKKMGFTKPFGSALISWIIISMIACLVASLLRKLKIVRTIYG